MRPLTSREIESVSGAETIHYQLPAGVTMSTRLERNHSTSITFRGLPGVGTYTWHSGTFVSCYMIAGGLQTEIFYFFSALQSSLPVAIGYC